MSHWGWLLIVSLFSFVFVLGTLTRRLMKPKVLVRTRPELGGRCRLDIPKMTAPRLLLELALAVQHFTDKFLLPMVSKCFSEDKLVISFSPPILCVRAVRITILFSVRKEKMALPSVHFTTPTYSLFGGATVWTEECH